MKIAIFASGSGSNFEALAKNFSVSFLVCDHADAGVVERSKKLGIKTFIVEKNKFEKREDHEARILAAIRDEDFEVICLAGWMRLLSKSFLSQFPQGSVLNIHPSMLPLYPGTKGYEDSFAAGGNGGVTVHEVDAGIDTGKILAQISFERTNDLASFKSAGLAIEHRLYSQVVREVLEKSYLHRVEVLPRARELMEKKDHLVSRVVWIKTKGPCAQFAKIVNSALVDPVSESLFWQHNETYETHLAVLGFAAETTERGFHPGVTDNAANQAREALELVTGKKYFQVRSGESHRGFNSTTKANPLLQWEKLTATPFEEYKWLEVAPSSIDIREISLAGNDDHLNKMNQDNWWALTLPELRLVRDYYLSLGRNPTDVEMEVIAQTWSEHCKHKIFRAEIEFSDEESGTTRTVKSLFKTFIKGVTDEVREKRQLDWLVSVFDDNAGVVRWDEKLDVSIKVETHNSPSALDPYGGALTGILGVNRDILGVGMGARPIANTNVFCLAPPSLDQHLGNAWPRTVLPPADIRTGVHAGVKDGGNKSGIPTVNGAFHYDVNYAGKPLVYCGTLGVMPRIVNGKPSHEKPVSPGDRVVMVGGRIGKDGLHGATFSSMEWKEGTPASVVQIGDPITQKRLTDFILEARDRGLYSGLTDNGAGGLSSSIGEMSLFTGGATIDLALAPTKYPGLAPWELMVSESQERMSVAVPLKHLKAFMELAQSMGVEASDLGEFTNSGSLRVLFAGKIVADLALSFLHESLPPMQLKARWKNSIGWSDWCEKPELKKSLPVRPDAQSLKEALSVMLAHLNVRSHEKWVRQYDHEVQAASRAKPFSRAGAPSDAGVIAMKPHGGEEKTAVVVGSGLNPQISRHDPYVMGVWAVDEAVRNTICAGGDPERMALVDNFCWPDPVVSAKNADGDVKLGMLVRTCEGMAETALAMGLPLVSGKDSMKNDAFVESLNRPVKISALPTLLMTCMAHLPDVSKALPSVAPEAGLSLMLLSCKSPLSAVTLAQNFQLATTKPEAGELTKLAQFYKQFHQAFLAGLFKSAHDVGEGGLLTAVAEISVDCMGHEIDIDGDWTELFGEGTGHIVVSCSENNVYDIKSLIPDAKVIGRTFEGGGLRLPKYAFELVATELAAHYRRDV